jgi:Uri superfamily endonuclease
MIQSLAIFEELHIIFAHTSNNHWKVDNLNKACKYIRVILNTFKMN